MKSPGESLGSEQGEKKKQNGGESLQSPRRGQIPEQRGQIAGGGRRGGGGGGGGGGGAPVFTLRRRLSLIQNSLKDDNLVTILSFLDGYNLARLSVVCKDWAMAQRDPLLWQNMCLQLWQNNKWLQNRIADAKGDWRKVFVTIPHLRYDGYYVLEKRDFRPGGNGFMQRVGSFVVEVAYYRYLRFAPKGKVWYALLNDDPVGRPLRQNDKRLAIGRYGVREGVVSVAVDLGYVQSVIKLELSQTPEGHNDKLDCSELKCRDGPGSDIIELKMPGQSFYFHCQPLF